MRFNPYIMELCIKCKKYQIDIDSDPYCKTCWKLTEGYLFQIQPIEVLSIISDGEKTYKEIMAQPNIKQLDRKSSHSVGISLRA